MLRILLGVGLSVVLVSSSAMALEGAGTRKERVAKETMKEIGEAQKAYEAEKWDDVITHSEKVLANDKLDPKLAYPAHQLHLIAYLKKDPANACKTIMPDLEFVTAADQMVLKDKPDAEKAAKAADFQSLKGKCQNDLKVGDKGLAAYGMAIQMDPSNWSHYWGRCWVNYQNEKYAEALPDCQKAAQLNATDVQSRKVIANSLQHLDRNQEALTAWQDVLEVAPNDEMAKKTVADLKKLLKVQ